MPTNRQIRRGLKLGIDDPRTLKNPRREKLKPCPFDGGKGVISEIKGVRFPFAVRCITCNATTARTRTLGPAVSKWQWRFKC